MRKRQVHSPQTDIKILALDDDPVMVLTLQSYFQGVGFTVDTENDPYAAIERVRNGHYDILLLDFLMTPICGDQVVDKIRQFNTDLYIILLTGHKSMAPPIKTIRDNDIQGYYEKSDRFDQLELLVESCVKSICQMRTIRSYQKGLKQILRIMPSLYLMRSTAEVSSAVLSTMMNLLGCVGGYIALKTSSLSKEDFLSGSRGDYSLQVIGSADSCFNQSEIDDWAKDSPGDALYSPTPTELTVKLFDGEKLFGYMGAYGIEAPSEHAEQLFELFARQSSAALCSCILNGVVFRQNAELVHVNERLNSSYLDVIRVLRLAVDARDIYTRGHSDRVSYYATKIARAMGRDDDYCRRVEIAGLFHDIGKLGLPDGILLKCDRLTDAEYAIIKEHSARGYQILSSVSSFDNIAPIVLSHHERCDGKGYPDSHSFDYILEEARVIAVADSFDAMTSTRRYRAGLTLDEAINELISGRNTQFDGNIVDVFLTLLDDYDIMQAELAWTHSPGEWNKEGSH